MSSRKDKKCLLDSAIPQNIMGDLLNSSPHSEYDGTNEIILVYGSCLAVSHIGYSTSHSPHRTFTLCDILYVPNLCKKLIFPHHPTKQNDDFVEFHPFYFIVKDKIMG